MSKWVSGAGTDAEQVLKGEGTGTGYNLAALYKHTDALRFGASYRSGAKIKVEGSTYHPLLGNIAAQAASGNGSNGSYYYNDANTKIHLPDTFQPGAAYQYNDKLQLTAEADWTNWANYHKLVIKWYGDTASSTEHKSWNSVWAYRLGAQYKYCETLKLRGGAFYDNNPVPALHFETRLPDSDRVGLSLGAGWTRGDITVDASYLYLMFQNRVSRTSIGGATGTTENEVLDGKYSASAHLPALTVSYKF
jgi:long-chain fatty acid transport protein